MPQKTENRRRKPLQSRSRQTVEAILEAAAQILESHGPEQGNTNRIAQRAGVSIGTLYQYFPNKEALYAELARRFIDAQSAETERAFATLPLRPTPELVAHFMVTLSQLDTLSPRLQRTLFELPGSQALMVAANARLEAALVKVLAREPDLEGRDLEMIARVLVRAVDGVLRDTTLREPERADDPRLWQELTRLVVGYLEAGAGQPPDEPGRVDPPGG
ncbi:MAG: TetR/AcrR family transcriptional regulator [Myxococcota bacterium]